MVHDGNLGSRDVRFMLIVNNYDVSYNRLGLTRPLQRTVYSAQSLTETNHLGYFRT